MGATPQKWGTPMGWGGSGDPPLKSGGPPKKWGPPPKKWGPPQEVGTPPPPRSVEVPRDGGGPAGIGVTWGDPKAMGTPKTWRP